METKIYSYCAPQEFDIAGQPLSRPLFNSKETISYGLADRLFNYAECCLINIGIYPPPRSKVEVSAIREWEDQKPSEMTYCVTWITEKGGEMGVQGIQTNKGWPQLDHGMFIHRG